MSDKGWLRNLLDDIRWGWADWRCRQWGHRPQRIDPGDPDAPWLWRCSRCRLDPDAP